MKQYSSDKLQFESADSVEIGDIDGGNKTVVEDDGTVRFDGDAIVWDDLRVSLERGKPGSTQPAWTSFNGGLYAYQFDNGEEIHFSVQLPHKWKEGTDIFPHLHFSPSSYVGTLSYVGIGLEYSWANIGDQFPAPSHAITYHDVTGALDKEHLVSNFATYGLDGSGKEISSVLLCRFYRVAPASNDYADAIWGLEVDFHHQIDTCGSRGIVTK